ncbi:MAG: sensor histidine kinase [Oscillospiraceae bacterium]
MFLLICLCAVLSAAVIILLIKIYNMKRSAREIREKLAERLSADTNTLIDISSSDRDMCALAADLNVQLKQLREERLRCRHGDLELKEAVTNISHDLRTPLTAICGYLDLLEKEEMSENARRYLAFIKNRTESLRQLTGELFSYSVVTSSRELKPEKTDICAALEETLLSFYGEFKEKGITPEITLPEEPVFRILDRTALNRIFSNIISNGAKYSSGDFSVKIYENGTVQFSNTAKSLNSVMTGRLFDRFYTVEASRNSTGLGLSIAKRLTESMNGSINAEYREQKLFITLFFPAEQDTPD